MNRTALLWPFLGRGTCGAAIALLYVAQIRLIRDMWLPDQPILPVEYFGEEQK